MTDSPAAEDLVAIARFSNMAEAGYFGIELGERLTVEPRIEAEEDFDYSTGSWSHRYVMLVPQAMASEAATLLQGLLERDATDLDVLEETERSENGGWSTRHVEFERAEHGLELRSMLLPIGLVFGVAVGWVVATSRRQPQQPEQGAAWNQLREYPEVWEQPLPNGEGVRELKVLPNGRFEIREDKDGDGRFESWIRR